MDLAPGLYRVHGTDEYLFVRPSSVHPYLLQRVLDIEEVTHLCAAGGLVLEVSYEPGSPHLGPPPPRQTLHLVS